jgi:hypothetical protein
MNLTKPNSPYIKNVVGSGFKEFTTVSENGTLVSIPTACKEFVLDHHSLAVNEKPQMIIYGGQEAPPPPSLQQVLVYFSGKPKHVVNSEKLVHQFEDRLEIPHSLIYSTSFEYGYIFCGSLRWMIAPPMLSLYTLLIRLGYTVSDIDSIFTTKSLSATDDVILKSGGIEGIKKILKHGDKKIFGEDIKVNWPPNNTYIHAWGVGVFGGRKYLDPKNKQGYTHQLPNEIIPRWCEPGWCED